MEALIGCTDDQSDGRRDSAQPLLYQTSYQNLVIASKVTREPNDGTINLVSHTHLDDHPRHRYLNAQDAPS